MLPLRQDRRQQMALKIALGSLLAAVIVLWAHAENPFWAPALVIVFMGQYLEAAISSGISRVLSTASGGFFSIFLAHFTIHSEPLFLLCLCFIIALSIYGFLVYGSGWLNFAVTFTFIYLYLMSNPSGGFDIAYWRLLQITLAAVIWVLMSAFIFPNRAYKDSKDQFSETLKQYADYLTKDIYEADHNWNKSKTALSKNFTILSNTTRLLSSANSTTSRFLSVQRAIESFWALWQNWGKIITSPDLEIKNYKTQLDRIACAFIALADSRLERNVLERSRDELSAAFHEITDYSLKNNALISTELFNHLYESILCLWDSLSGWLYGTCLISRKKSRESLSFIWHDLRSRPERIRHSLCAGLGCTLVVVIWFTTGWEGGVCAAVSALVVGADFSLTKINLKIRLRMYGSFTGSLFAGLLVIYVIKNLALLLICLFVGLLIFGYLATGNFNQMYFSWMATISYVITLIPSDAMVTNFDFALERSVGLIFGLAVMLFVMNFFFQIDPNQVMARHQRRILGKTAEFFSALAEIISGKKDSGYTRLEKINNYLREEIITGDVLAKQTNQINSWAPVREILVQSFWCYRYLKKTTILSDGLDNTALALFLFACENAEAKLHPHQSYDAGEIQQPTEKWDDPSATLFFREFNTLLKKINAFQPYTADNKQPKFAPTQ
jgi:uncharacterized membrane protein YccC